MSYRTPSDITPAIDFTAEPEVVRVVVEGERLTYGHLFNPAFATEISRIEPLPHQRIAVYEHMLQQSRLRFLLADDAGAGKTIMTGLYIREMLTRRLISRVLIVPPAGLVGNWEHEMRSLFNLSFRIVNGNEAKTNNPFTEPDGKSDLLIVSVDTLRGDTMFSRLQEPEVVPYDLVIFDEAHKLAADREADQQGDEFSNNEHAGQPINEHEEHLAPRVTGAHAILVDRFQRGMEDSHADIAGFPGRIFLPSQGDAPRNHAPAFILSS